MPTRPKSQDCNKNSIRYEILIPHSLRINLNLCDLSLSTQIHSQSFVELKYSLWNEWIKHFKSIIMYWGLTYAGSCDSIMYGELIFWNLQLSSYIRKHDIKYDNYITLRDIWKQVPWVSDRKDYISLPEKRRGNQFLLPCAKLFYLFPCAASLICTSTPQIIF